MKMLRLNRLKEICSLLDYAMRATGSNPGHEEKREDRLAHRFVHIVSRMSALI
jgi:hypothetical protein